MSDHADDIVAPGPDVAAHGVVRAINRIFREALSARSEEQLAQLALMVAEDVTGAGMSFLGEVNEATGRMDDIAISERGWQAYTRPHPDFPPRVPPTGLERHGLFGRVLRDGCSIIANDPARHEDRVGAPAWHPGLDNFLGVPLKLGEKTIGMVGLANRPGGFRETDRAAAEEMAPAIVQALLSKRSEQALQDSRRRLRAVLEGIPQLVWTARDGGDWTSASPQWAGFTGLSARESMGRGWLAALHEDDRADALDMWRNAARRGRLSMESRVWSAKEGRHRWFRIRAEPVRDEDGAIVEWFGTCTDIDEQRRMQDHQVVLVGELQHRVRNILTIVRSVFARTVEAGGDLDEVTDHFRGRLDALARTQVVVTNNPSGVADLENLIRDELLSVGVSDGPGITLGGPDVLLPGRAAETLGLAIHELTMNAVKYGALRARNGRLAVTWSVNILYDGQKRLELQWDEQGVPAVPLMPARKGFGIELIEEALPYRLGADTVLEFRGGGVRCTIVMALPESATLSARRESG